jgi:hypothetical protein
MLWAVGRDDDQLLGCRSVHGHDAMTVAVSLASTLVEAQGGRSDSLTRTRCPNLAVSCVADRREDGAEPLGDSVRGWCLVYGSSPSKACAKSLTAVGSTASSP